MFNDTTGKYTFHELNKYIYCNFSFPFIFNNVIYNMQIDGTLFIKPIISVLKRKTLSTINFLLRLTKMTQDGYICDTIGKYNIY